MSNELGCRDFDLSARINRVSRRSLDGSVVMSSEEWNNIVELVEELLTAAQSGQGVEAISTCYEDCLCEHGNGCKLESESHPQPEQPSAGVEGLVEALEAISRNELDAQRAQHVADVALDNYREGDQS